ncbi:sugar isomerase domain-containing protein [Candidatus Clostridium radicumherbarum]|uniref:Sugar isomerase domain-containing protein n=1 Tax=Candidatus Clostridium radicumherbarum TaxID=3381662 RepID=A0ABW8TU34_9CLOT
MNFDYVDRILELIKTIEIEEKDNMEKCVELITKTILEKRSIYTFGASHAGILSEEMYYRAGGLMMINPIFGREIMLDTSPITITSKMERCVGYGTILASKINFMKDDLLIIHSVSGRNPVSIELAIAAKEKSVKIVGLTNLEYSKSVSSRHHSGNNLYEFCDIVLDNHGDIGDACVALEGLEQKVGPTSTVIGATLLNSIIAATAQNLVKKGMKNPPIFYSANIDGGDELNEKLYEQYKNSIHYKFK